MSYVDEVTADSPVAWYRMEEASGMPQDSSGNANHITVNNGVSLVYSEPGALPSDATSKSIRGTEINFSAPDHATLDLGDVFTMEAWVKRNTTSDDTYFISKETNAYALRINASNELQLDKYAFAAIVVSTVTITNDGAFHHCVATKTGATVKLYVDGVDRTGTVTNQTFENNTGLLHIGSDGSAGLALNGWLDEVAVYPTALSAARVSAHYNAAIAAAAVSDDPPVGILGRGAGW